MEYASFYAMSKPFSLIVVCLRGSLIIIMKICKIRARYAHVERNTDTHTHRQTDRRTDRPTDRQTDRQTGTEKRRGAEEEKEEEGESEKEDS